MLACGLGASRAWAQAPDDDDIDDAPKAPKVLDEAKPKTTYGVGIRLRQVVVPKGMIELFVERAESGSSHTGFGLELIRRKANLEISLGFEYESLSGESGFWIDKGEQIPQDDPDWVEFDNFGWITTEVNFIWHTPLHEKVHLRYGAGLGLGIIRGDVLQTDAQCTDVTVSSCMIQPNPANNRKPNDNVPPVFPVINLTLGAQIRPTENIAINIEGGMRTAFFLGATGVFYF
jgi:hypothetical protein